MCLFDMSIIRAAFRSPRPCSESSQLTLATAWWAGFAGSLVLKGAQPAAEPPGAGSALLFLSVLEETAAAASCKTRIAGMLLAAPRATF